MKNGLSIIISYYYGSRFIMDCLNSIFDSYSISNKFLSLEVILIVDSPNDNSIDFNKLKSDFENICAFKIIKNEINIGVAKSRNKGLSFSSQNHFTILDQDDFVESNYFSVVESHISKGENDIYILNGRYKFVNQKSSNIFFFTPSFTLKSILMQHTNIVSPGLVIFNKKNIGTEEFFFETSPFFKGCDDWAAYLKIIFTKTNLQCKYINKVLFNYRYHDSNYSNNIREMIYSALSVIDYFSTYKTVESRNLLKKARIRYQFLYLVKVKNYGFFKILRVYPEFTLQHYFFSFFNLERLNSALSKITKK